MNFSFAQDLSVYQLALGVQAPPQALPHSPATLLSLVRSQIDLLIEQQIAATLWVKLPPGKIWHSEIQRYHQQLRMSGVIHTLYIEESWSKENGQHNLPLSPHSIAPSENLHDIRVQTLQDSQLQREYFVMVLSPQFCCLILAHRPLRRRRNNSAKANRKKTPPLLAITTFDGRVIQQVFHVIKQAITPESPLFVPADFICPAAPEPALMSQLLAKQLQRQDEMNRQRTRKHLAKMQQKNQKLQDTLQFKDEYLSNVCQELRAPLTHMKTALSLLNSPNLKPPQRQRYFQMLNTQCDRQNALISGVLDLVQLERNLERISLEPVRLSDIVPGVVSTYQPLAQEKGIMLAYTVPTELPPVWCVSGGLRQIVINLLSNSIKFTSNGGQVWVRGRVQGDDVQLEFRDTGIGIADNEIPKILDRFYRVRPAATEDPGGVGLGLSIVQLLLWRGGGSLSVKSKLCEGSTFTVQLPIAPENPTQELV
ncbi:DICT sensory domain-containing protein [Mastigocladopsis repens]|uniref:DICT sensory domain-containing protein n=1 Tax=Mastigocladopsis repens TaxID=221287 RepID=UPI00035FC959|nr:DICT sensory domain-containing protein [Mastigocladopsis repens]